MKNKLLKKCLAYALAAATALSAAPYTGLAPVALVQADTTYATGTVNGLNTDLGVVGANNIITGFGFKMVGQKYAPSAVGSDEATAVEDTTQVKFGTDTGDNAYQSLVAIQNGSRTFYKWGTYWESMYFAYDNSGKDSSGEKYYAVVITDENTKKVITYGTTGKTNKMGATFTFLVPGEVADGDTNWVNDRQIEETAGHDNNPEGSYMMRVYEIGESTALELDSEGKFADDSLTVLDTAQLTIVKMTIDASAYYKNTNNSPYALTTDGAYYAMEGSKVYLSEYEGYVWVDGEGNVVDTDSPITASSGDSYILTARTDISDATVTVTDGVYSGDVITPTTTVTVNGTTLSSDCYSVEYYSDEACSTSATVKNAGTYYAKITGTGLYTGSVVKSFKITTEQASSGSSSITPSSNNNSNSNTNNSSDKTSDTTTTDNSSSETTTNSDGSTTVTTTDTAGNVTETTTSADGSTVTTEVTNADGTGSVTETVTSDAGTVTTSSVETNASGYATTVTVSTENASGGEKTVEYEVSDSGTLTLSDVDTNVKSLSIPKTVTAADGNTYSVTAIAAGAAKGEKTLTKLSVGSNVETIGSGAFSNCTSLKSVTIGSGITKISKNAFKGDTSLKKVTINCSSLKSVGKNAFSGISSKAVIVLKGTKKQVAKATKLIKKSGISSKVTIKRG